MTTSTAMLPSAGARAGWVVLPWSAVLAEQPGPDVAARGNEAGRQLPAEMRE
jgi:hypothetical protein